MELSIINDNDKQKLSKLLQTIPLADQLCIDVETNSLDPISGKLLLFQIKAGDDIFIIDCLHTEPRVVKYIVEIIHDTNKLCIGHNIKFDIEYLYVKTGELLTNVYDTSIVENLLTAGVGKKFYSLNDLTEKYLGITLDKDVRETFYTEEVIEFTQEQLIYSALDVTYLEEIRVKQIKDILFKKLLKVFELEMKLVPVVADMEVTGIRIDIKKWAENNGVADGKVENLGETLLANIIEMLLERIDYRHALDVFEKLAITGKVKKTNTKKRRKELENIIDSFEIFQEVKLELNLDSPLQLLKCFQTLGFDIEDTNEKTINKLNDPLVDELLQYREYAKKASSFGEKFLANINPVTGKIHTKFHQTGAATGRFRSDSPNLQNIERESVYRDCFIADEGFYLVTADYSQAELRLLGDVSQEPKFIDAYQNDRDLHLETAVELFGLPREKIDKKQRQHAKNTNFAIVYGSSEWGLYRNFGIPIEDGKEFLRKHRLAFPDLYRFMDAVSVEISRRLYSITPLGRRRYFKAPEFNGDYKELGKQIAAIKRQGINHIIQGGSADITKLAMIGIFYNNPFGRDKFKLLLTVHDELVVMVHNTINPEEAMQYVRDTMNAAGNSIMKIIRSKVDVSYGQTWSK